MSHKIVHLCVLEKFVPPFIKLVHENFPPAEHLFLVSGKSGAYALPEAPGVIRIRNLLQRLKHLRDLYSAEKIILHGLYDAKYLYLFVLQPWLLKKCYWAIWGADLYQYLEKKERLKTRIKEKARAFVIRRMGYLVGFVEADCELARQWYGCRAKTIPCMMYGSNTYHEINPETRHQDSDIIRIQVGNSAYPGNNHIEALEKIAPFRDRGLEIYVPLSYGPKKIAEETCARGEKLFGAHFHPLLDFMSLADYQRHLAEIDIAVFYNTRQQAMGNIVALLGMGKTVYMRRTTVWSFFEELGVKFFDAENFTPTLLDDAGREHNKRIIKSYFSSENLLRQLGALFSHRCEILDIPTGAASPPNTGTN